MRAGVRPRRSREPIVTAEATGTGAKRADVRGAVTRRLVPVPTPAAGAPRLDPEWDPAPLEFVQQRADEWVPWSVVEVDAAAVPGARASRCLLFSRPECIRRVWDYPADWRTLDDDALTALSWHR